MNSRIIEPTQDRQIFGDLKLSFEFDLDFYPNSIAIKINDNLLF